MSWVCKNCNNNNDDSLTECEVCGCTERLGALREEARPLVLRARKAAELCAEDDIVYIPIEYGVIGANAFEGKENILIVVLHSGVKSIHKEAFANCVKLRAVTGGTHLRSIGERAFYNCRSLTARPTAERIADDAFDCDRTPSRLAYAVPDYEITDSVEDDVSEEDVSEETVSYRPSAAPVSSSATAASRFSSRRSRGLTAATRSRIGLYSFIGYALAFAISLICVIVLGLKNELSADKWAIVIATYVSAVLFTALIYILRQPKEQKLFAVICGLVVFINSVLMFVMPQTYLNVGVGIAGVYVAFSIALAVIAFVNKEYKVGTTGILYAIVGAISICVYSVNLSYIIDWEEWQIILGAETLLLMSAVAMLVWKFVYEITADSNKTIYALETFLCVMGVLCVILLAIYGERFILTADFIVAYLLLFSIALSVLAFLRGREDKIKLALCNALFSVISIVLITVSNLFVGYSDWSELQWLYGAAGILYVTCLIMALEFFEPHDRIEGQNLCAVSAFVLSIINIALFARYLSNYVGLMFFACVAVIVLSAIVASFYIKKKKILCAAIAISMAIIHFIFAIVGTVGVFEYFTWDEWQWFLGFIGAIYLITVGAGAGEVAFLFYRKKYRIELIILFLTIVVNSVLIHVFSDIYYNTFVVFAFFTLASAIATAVVSVKDGAGWGVVFSVLCGALSITKIVLYFTILIGG